jgi:hypothetical protein
VVLIEIEVEKKIVMVIIELMASWCRSLRRMDAVAFQREREHSDYE